MSKEKALFISRSIKLLTSICFIPIVLFVEDIAWQRILITALYFGTCAA